MESKIYKIYDAMKNLNKILFAVSGVLLLGGGAVLAYMQARPQPEFSDLTLANIEALAGGGEASAVAMKKDRDVTYSVRTVYWSIKSAMPIPVSVRCFAVSGDSLGIS